MPNAGDGIDLTQRGRTSPTTSSVVSIWQINQVFNGLLLSGSADGSVRLWRDYTFPRTQRLATAWQVIPSFLLSEEGLHGLSSFASIPNDQMLTHPHR